MGKVIHILYGSQTGNAEFIAKDLHDKVKVMEVSCLCQPLNSVKKVDLKAQASMLIIICSTTGNGDSPENSEQWWRSIKLRSIAKDMLQNIPYCVLGLGDTNYDKFCHMGKSIDKRLAELGGSRCLDIFCADEATNLEETVENWKAAILDLIKRRDGVATDAREMHQSKATLDTVECLDQAIITTLRPELDTSDVLAPHQTKACSPPAGLLNCRAISLWFQMDHLFSSSPPIDELPKSMKSSQSKYSIAPTNAQLKTSIEEISTPSSVNSTCDLPAVQTIWDVERPFHSSVLKANWLTISGESNSAMQNDWGTENRVVHLELSIADSGIAYSPGDSIGICCPNPEYLVDIVINRIVSNEISQIDSETLIMDQGSQTFHTLKEILSYRVDLVSIPKKIALATLGKYCSDSLEACFVEWLCSKGVVGKRLWENFVEKQQIGVAEFLYLVPSCCPPVNLFLSTLSSMPPRYYSISSSPLSSINQVAVAFSIVHYVCGITEPNLLTGEIASKICRFGVCTSYLETLLGSYLQKSSSHSILTPKIRIFHKASLSFHMPSSVSVPLILVGPGTGVSPFIGFLEHRNLLEKERMRVGHEMSTGVWRGGFTLEQSDLPSESNHIDSYLKSVEPGPVNLFFGCRNSSDFLYRSVLENFVLDRTLTNLYVAMSRVGSEKVYVTHYIRKHSKQLSRIILHDGAYIYVCGDGNQMAKDVYAAFRDCLVEGGGMTTNDADELLLNMRNRKRYLLDVWS